MPADFDLSFSEYSENLIYEVDDSEYMQQMAEQYLLNYQESEWD